ncbi:MAG: metallophosphoesterase, partial [Candidatus Brocadiae bacterium]|nr:metallophosphoesterase [Candidatus Brocadiia bacterium]
WYSFDYGNAHFIVLDTEVRAEREEMLEWLEHDLAEANAEWTFVCYHIPTFNIGGHGSTWGQDDFLPMMERHGVDFVVCGHSHLYERFLPIGQPGKKPLIHIVSGGGGAPTYAAEYSPTLAGGIGRSELHHCVFEVDGNRCEMTVRRPDGSVIDALSLIKMDGMYQDEVMALAVETETAKQTAFVFADLRADFEVIPRSGQSAQAAISAEGLPPEMTVTIAPVEGAGGWQLESQTLVVRDGRFVFEVRAPEDMSASLAGFEPPLRMALTVTHEGRAFSVGDVEVGLGEDTLRRVIPAPEPVGIAYAEAAVTVDGDLSEWRDISPMPLPFVGKETGALR